MRAALRLSLGLMMASLALVVSAMAQTPAPAPTTSPPAPPPPAIAQGTLLNNKNVPIGAFQIQDAPGGVVMKIAVDKGGLTPGWHAVHFHEVGMCDDAEKFMKAGGHINPEKKEHGLLNPKGPDNGDLPNIHAGADGSANAEMFSPFVRVREGKVVLLDGDGSAVMIHANPDDHVTQPIGGAGPRVACGVIEAIK